jgi:pimeloyl-ACP methyl ester carboxylesterase
MRKQSNTAFLLLFCLFLQLPALAANSTLEQNYAQALQKRIKNGKVVKLEAGTDSFIGIFIEHGNNKSKGGVILLHDRSQHPDWPYVIRPIRTKLPGYGWNTLSIQLPILSHEASFMDHEKLLDPASSRIIAAINFMRSKGEKSVVLIGYGMGALMAVDYLAKTPQKNVTSLIAISMTGKKGSDRLDSASQLLNIKIPVLDIVAQLDNADVLNAFKARKKMHSKYSAYRQITIDASDHSFIQQDDILLKRIRGWRYKQSEK